MKKRVILAVSLAVLISFSCCTMNIKKSTTQKNHRSAHSIILDAFTKIAYDFHCERGDEMTGIFLVTCDGSLYIGDEQKYDDWSLEGIQFYILDAGNYTQLVQGESFEPVFAEYNAISLSWSFKVPSAGIWYIVYENNTTYLMSIHGSINTPGPSRSLLVIILSSLIVTAILLGIVAIITRNRKQE